MSVYSYFPNRALRHHPHRWYDADRNSTTDKKRNREANDPMQMVYCSQLNIDTETGSEGNDFHGVRHGTKHESSMTVSSEAGGKNT